MFLKNFLEKITHILGLTTPKKKPLSCPCCYAEEKCIGGSPYLLEDFQSIMTHFAQLNDHNADLLGEKFSKKDPFGIVFIHTEQNGDPIQGHNILIPQSIIFEDLQENVFYAICRIKDKCEWVQYAYYISDKKGHKWYDYIGKNEPVTDSRTIERIEKRLSVYKDLIITLLKKQEGKGKIVPKNIPISQQFHKEWLLLASLLSIPTRTANKICKSVLIEEEMFDTFLSEMIAADYLEVIDWKDVAEDVVYNYNLLSKRLKGTAIDLEIDNNTPPTEVFRLLASRSEFTLYQIDIDADSYFIGLCPKENAIAVQCQYKALFSVLDNQTSVTLIV